MVGLFDMARQHDNQKGLSLVELLVTTTIVGMIMLGIVSVDYALRTNEQEQTRAALVSLRTSAMMFDITSTASEAVGDLNDYCIQVFGTGANGLADDNTNAICIFRDKNATSTLDDGEWTCYTRQGTDLHKCTFDLSDIAPCSAGGWNSDRVIGTVPTDVFDDTDTMVVNNRATLSFYFQITLKNRYDPTATDYGDAVAQEYMTNPKIRLTSQVTPAGCVPFPPP